ncbi:MAG: hypothetical protein H6667_20885 [Ardenticatenaceae bacterium]|nr:hypothetical protein [Ardenticatenaceae bacterium]MCB9446465.1 hypothetical protein [Ardenticatenaceae bacterium]
MNLRWIFLLTFLITVSCQEDIIVPPTTISAPVQGKAITPSPSNTLPAPPTIPVNALPNLQTATPSITATPPAPTSTFSPESTIINLNNYDTSWNVELTGYSSGEISNMTIQGSYVYASFAGDLIVFDVSDANSPIPVGYLHLNYSINEIVVQDSLAYTIAHFGVWCDQEPCGGSFNVIDIAHPDIPTLLGSFEFPNHPTAMAIANETAYVIVNGELVIIDLADPERPTEIGHYSPTGYARDISIKGNYAYLVDKSILQILDISNPTTPIEMGYYDAGENAQISQPYINGDYAYITTYTGLLIIDISEPLHPIKAGSFIHPSRYNMSGVVVSGQYAYMHMWPYTISVVDISDLQNPFEVSQIDYCSDLTVANGYIYARCLGSLQLIDISDPKHPQNVGYYRPLSKPVTFDVFGDYAYAIPGDCYATCSPYPQLQIVDISGIVPNVLSTFETETTITNLFINENYAVFAMSKNEYCIGINVCSDNVHILDITNKTIPSEVGVYEAKGGVTATTIHDGILYLTLWGGKFIAVDITNPANPQAIDSINVPGLLQEIVIRGQTAYVVNAATGLNIIDISDPTHLQEIGALSIPPPSYAMFWDLDLYQDYAFLVGESGLLVVNITDPTHPVISATYDDAIGETLTVEVSGNFLFVGSVKPSNKLSKQSILRVFDISQPPILVEVGYFIDQMRYSSAKHLDLAVVDNVVYFANGDSELMNLKFR